MMKKMEDHEQVWSRDYGYASISDRSNNHPVMERTEDIRKILFKNSCQRCHRRWTDKRGSDETQDDINRREDGPALLW
jgi:hypothetical protein